VKFGGTIIIDSDAMADDIRERLERRLLRRSLSTAGDGRQIVVNCGKYRDRLRFTQWLDDQNLKYAFVSCDEPG
jgi:hypothetical protein